MPFMQGGSRGLVNHNKKKLFFYSPFGVCEDEWDFQDLQPVNEFFFSKTNYSCSTMATHCFDICQINHLISIV